MGHGSIKAFLSQGMLGMESTLCLLTRLVFIPPVIPLPIYSLSSLSSLSLSRSLPLLLFLPRLISTSFVGSNTNGFAPSVLSLANLNNWLAELGLFAKVNCFAALFLLLNSIKIVLTNDCFLLLSTLSEVVTGSLANCNSGSWQGILKKVSNLWWYFSWFRLYMCMRVCATDVDDIPYDDNF